MRKIISYVLMFAMILVMCSACGQKVQDVTEEAETAQTVENQDTQQAVEESTENSDMQTTETSSEDSQIKEEIVTETTEEPAPAAQTPTKQVIVCIDPGHGGDGDRNHGVEREYDGTMIMEKTLTLILAQKVKGCLEQQSGVTVVLTRTDDYAMGLSDRVNVAVSNNADFLVSLHINSSSIGNPDDNGCLAIVTQSHYQANGAKSADVYGSSEAIAANILANLNGLGIPYTTDFGVNTTGGLLRRGSESGAVYADGSAADYYGIISHATKAGIPACIVEHAFLSNESDYYNYLSDDAKLNALAQADANGILNYINGLGQ